MINNAKISKLQPILRDFSCEHKTLIPFGLMLGQRDQHQTNIGSIFTGIRAFLSIPFVIPRGPAPSKRPVFPLRFDMEPYLIAWVKTTDGEHGFHSAK